MNLFKRVIIAAVIFCPYKSDAQLTKVFSLPFPQQYAAIDSVLEEHDRRKNPPYNQGFVDEMTSAAVKTNNELTILNCRRSILNYKYICSPYERPAAEYAQLVTESENLLSQVDAEKYPELKAMLYKILGNIYYYKVKQFSLAFENYLKAYNLFKNVSVERFPDRQYSQYVIALAYYQFNDYQTAIALGNEIESLYPQKNHISIYNIDMIGMAHLRLQQYNAAIDKFQWILNNLQYAKRPVAWKGIASGNIGLAYFLQHDPEKALPFLEPAVDLTLKEDVVDNAADFAAYVATIYLEKGNAPEAKKYIDIAQRSAYKSNAASNYYTVYKTLADYYKQEGNVKLALFYLDSAIIFKDSLARMNDVNLKYKGEMAVERERKDHEEKIATEARRRQVLTRNGLVILIIAAMVITLLFYNRSRLKAKNREQQLVAEKQLAESELNNAVTQLNDFTKTSIEKNMLLENASKRIEELNEICKKLENEKPGFNSTFKDTDSIKLLQESVLLTDEDWKNFTRLFDKVYPGFFIRLKEKLPALFPAEIRFMALSKLKLNSKEMAAILGITQDAIRQSRSRLRKKLDIGEDGSIEEAVDKI